LTELDRCLAAGGVVVFPTDTVYGLGCDVENADAVRRLYELKGRPRQKPAAVLWTDLIAALDALPELGPRTRAALAALLPGPVTALVPHPSGRFRLAGGEALGLRVPRTELAAARPLLQSSANLAGEPDARRLADVPPAIRAGADLVIDGGELPGTPSSVIDLTAYETGAWRLVRAGALSEDAVAARLDAPAGVPGRPANRRR
jgi:L-threonylcarbamoyladenylate synthase